MGAAELIVILLSLSGFGVQANPNAPSAQELARYAPDSPDVMIHLDAQAVLPGNWKYLQSLAEKPEFQGSPALKGAITGTVDMAKAGLDMVKAQIGFDPIQDLHSVTAFASYAEKGDPMFLCVARGSFPADIVDKVSKMGPHPKDSWETVDGVKVLVDHDGKVAAARAADGTLLFGSKAWVKERVAKKWKGKAVKKGSLLDRGGAWIDAKPFFLVASAPSARARGFFAKEMGKDTEAAAVLELMTGHDFMAVAMAHDGVSWTYRARDVQGFESAALASDGVIELMRASHHVTRGLAELVLAGLGAYAKFDKNIAEVVKRRADILQVVFSLSGDGNFQASVDASAADKTVTVKATGKTLSEVLPAGGFFIPAAAGAFLFISERDSDYTEPAMTKPASVEPPKPVAPAVKKKAK